MLTTDHYSRQWSIAWLSIHAQAKWPREGNKNCLKYPSELCRGAAPFILPFCCHHVVVVYGTDVVIRIQEVDLESETIGSVYNMRISPSRTVAELQIAIASRLSISPYDVRCVIERYYNTLKLLDVPSKTLLVEGFQKTNKVNR